jgi:hypothetical protein
MIVARMPRPRNCQGRRFIIIDKTPVSMDTVNLLHD